MEKIEKLKPGFCYHIYNRGNNKENLFIEEENYFYFLRLFAKYINPIAGTYCYCLMKNHFHFLIRIKDKSSLSEKLLSKKEPNISQPFSNLFNAYSKSINKKYNRSGSLFKKRFRRIKINDQDYLKDLVLYIHLNPVKHKFTDDFANYPFSSYNSILSDSKTDLKGDEVISWFGDRDNYIFCHKEKFEANSDLTGLEDL